MLIRSLSVLLQDKQPDVVVLNSQCVQLPRLYLAFHHKMLLCLLPQELLQPIYLDFRSCGVNTHYQSTSHQIFLLCLTCKQHSHVPFDLHSFCSQLVAHTESRYHFWLSKLFRTCISLESIFLISMLDEFSWPIKTCFRSVPWSPTYEALVESRCSSILFRISFYILSLFLSV